MGFGRCSVGGLSVWPISLGLDLRSLTSEDLRIESSACGVQASVDSLEVFFGRFSLMNLCRPVIS